MSKIAFFYEDTNFILPNIQQTKAWIKAILKSEQFQLEHINYIFCSDKYLHSLNYEYLNHDTLTDIITFDYTEEYKIEGDIYISVDRVGENSASFKTSFDQEIKRVMAHGLLHMMGYSDKTDEDKTLMREKEDSCLSLHH